PVDRRPSPHDARWCPPGAADREDPDPALGRASDERRRGGPVEPGGRQAGSAPRSGLLDEQEPAGRERSAEHRVATQLGVQSTSIERLARTRMTRVAAIL